MVCRALSVPPSLGQTSCLVDRQVRALRAGEAGCGPEVSPILGCLLAGLPQERQSGRPDFCLGKGLLSDVLAARWLAGPQG